MPMKAARTLTQVLNWLLRPVRNWRIIAAAFASIGVLHILATLAVPHLGSASAYSRLAASLPLNEMSFIGQPSPGNQPLPFMGADASYAMCHFDATRNPVVIQVFLPGNGWTLSLHAPDGANTYAATGREDRPITVNIKVIPAGDRFAGLTPEALGYASRAVQSQVVRMRRGIAVIRAPDRSFAYQPQVQRDLARSNCYQLTANTNG
jgi:uncharacterized membrane protein